MTRLDELRTFWDTIAATQSDEARRQQQTITLTLRFRWWHARRAYRNIEPLCALARCQLSIMPGWTFAFRISGPRYQIEALDDTLRLLHG